MNSRERVLRTLEHREPDRVPFNLRPSEEMRARLRAEQNDPEVDFADFFKHDIRSVWTPLPACPPDVPKCDWVPRPAPDDIAISVEYTRRLHERGLAVASGYHMGVFEHAKDWFGDFETLTLPFDDPVRFEKELERITEWKLDVYGAYVKVGVDIVWIGDDLGMQRNLIMSPEHNRRWYKPCHLRMVEHFRRIRPDVRIAFHCCGFVTTLIPDLIEIGIDILEAVQAECIDIRLLKREFGRDISFWGGVGAQSVLARTTPEQVMEGVRKTLEIMSSGGGYIAAPCHTLTSEVSWESAIAFHQAIQRYGAYPHPGTRNADAGGYPAG